MGNSHLTREPLYPEGCEEHLPECTGARGSDRTRFQDKS